MAATMSTKPAAPRTEKMPIMMPFTVDETSFVMVYCGGMVDWTVPCIRTGSW